jgi:FlaA1/EpsC-like NDP-sugar epimerase
MIYGAGDAGVALAQELRRNSRFNRTVVGFLDDDPMKQRTRIQGLPVYGGLGDLRRAIAAAAAQEVIIAMTMASDEQVALVGSLCAEAGVGVSRFDLSLSMSGVDARLDRVT